ncbi:hypothetical protein TNCV_1195581, partial [Trichonephila clavipes]
MHTNESAVSVSSILAWFLLQSNLLLVSDSKAGLNLNIDSVRGLTPC